MYMMLTALCFLIGSSKLEEAHAQAVEDTDGMSELVVQLTSSHDVESALPGLGPLDHEDLRACARCAFSKQPLCRIFGAWALSYECFRTAQAAAHDRALRVSEAQEPEAAEREEGEMTLKLEGHAGRRSISAASAALHRSPSEAAAEQWMHFIESGALEALEFSAHHLPPLQYVAHAMVQWQQSSAASGVNMARREEALHAKVWQPARGEERKVAVGWKSSVCVMDAQNCVLHFLKGKRVPDFRVDFSALAKERLATSKLSSQPVIAPSGSWPLFREPAEYSVGREYCLTVSGTAEGHGLSTKGGGGAGAAGVSEEVEVMLSFGEDGGAAMCTFAAHMRAALREVRSSPADAYVQSLELV